MYFPVLILLLALFQPFALGVPTLQESSKISLNKIPMDSSLKGIRKCVSAEGVPGIINCVASKALTAIESLENVQNVELLPGITLTNTEIPNTRKPKELKTEALSNISNEGLNTKKLYDLFLASVSRFISGRSIKIQLDKTTQESLARAFEEGRGKMKKVMGPFMLGIGAKMLTVVPVVLSAVALLATKALVVGKLAFVISIILLFQQLTSGRGIIDPNFGTNLIPSFGIGPSYGVPGRYPYPSSTYGTNNIGGWASGGGYSPNYPYQRRSIPADEDSKDNSYSV